MPVPMPPVVVLVVCKVILGSPDDNTKYTHHLDSTWDTTSGVMHCRRLEVQLYDPSVDQGAAPQPFNQFQCNKAGVMQGSQFDVDHWDKPWRFRKHACPTPIIDTRTQQIIGWKIPECSTEHGTVICEMDTVI